jgi:hypothetical protein
VNLNWIGPPPIPPAHQDRGQDMIGPHTIFGILTVLGRRLA